MGLKFFKEASQRAAQAQALAAQNKKKKEDEERRKRNEQAKKRAEQKKKQQQQKSTLSKPTADTYKFDGNLKKYDGKVNIGNIKLSAPVAKQPVIQNEPVIQQKNSTVKDIASGVGRQLWGGYGKWAEGVNKAAYHGVKYIPGVGSAFKKAIDNQEAYNKANLEKGAEKIQKHLGNGFKSAAVNSLSQSAGQMIPDIVTTFMSAGTNRAASLAKLTADSGVSKWVKALKLPKESTPLFLSNLGNAYDDAIKNGANDGQALTSALINAYPQTVIEHSGGIQDLIKGKSKENVLKSIITSAIDEGKEELLQYPFEELSKLPYAPVTPYSSDPNEQAVINPKAQAQAAAVGALGGLVFGGVDTAFEGAANVAGKTVTGAKLKDFKQDIIDEGLNSPDGTYANDNALKLDNKKHVSLYDIGKQYELNVQQQENYKDGKYHTIPYDQPRKTIVPPSTEAEYKTQEKTVKKPVSTEFEGEVKEQQYGKTNQTVNVQAPIPDVRNASAVNGFPNDGVSQNSYDVNRAFTEFEALERAKYNETAKIKAVTPIYMQAKTLNSSQKRLVEDCRTLGIPVTFIEGTRVQTRGSSLNGAYYNGNIFINTSSENPYTVVAAHEVLHRIKDTDTEAYSQLCGIVDDALGKDNDFSGLGDYEKEEALADIMGDIIGDPKKYREVFRQKQNLLQRVIGYIRDMIARLTGKISGNFKNVSEFTESLKDAESKLTQIYKEVAGKTGSFEGETKYSDSQQHIYDYTKSFAEQVEDYKNGKIPERDSLLIGATPEVFKKIGLNSLPVTINQRHVDYALNGTKDIDHHIGEAMLSQLPEAIKDPVAVMRSQTNPNRIVALLEFAYNGKNIVAPFEIDGYGIQNSIVIDSNAIVSVYAKDNAISKQLKKAIQDEANGKISLFYLNKNKADVLLQKAGLQLPGFLFQNSGFIHSIREKGANVNTRFENVTETQQFKRWFGDWKNNPKKASKVVNDDGTPKVVYHGTKNFGFTTFDTTKSDDNSTLFFTDSNDMASTYSGKKGILKLQDFQTPDYSNKSPKEIVEALNNVKTADDEFMEQKYAYLDKDKIGSINAEIDKDAYALADYLEQYDFSNEKENIVKTVNILKSKLDNLEYDTISTPLYILLHHSSVFNNKDYANRFANLEKNIRLVNEVKKSGKTNVIISENLGGYSFYIHDIETAKDILSKKLSAGNYAVYLDIKNPFIVEVNGHNWNDITYYEVIPEDLKKFYPNGLWRHGTTREVAAYAKSHGFDGVIFKNIYDNGGNNSNIEDRTANVYVVFDSNQIKSATDNIGTFDKNNPDIRYSKKADMESDTKGETDDYLWHIDSNGKFNFKDGERHIGNYIYPNEAMLTKQDFKLADVLTTYSVPADKFAHLSDTKVVFDENSDSDTGYYDPKTDTIHLAKNDNNFEKNSELILRHIEDIVNGGEKSRVLRGTQGANGASSTERASDFGNGVSEGGVNVNDSGEDITKKQYNSGNTKRDVIDEIPKVDNYIRLKRGKFSKILSDIMNIKHIDIKNTVNPIYNELWNEYRKNGALPKDSADKFFESVFNKGRIINDEYYNRYKELKDEIGGTKFRISDDIKSEIADYSDFRRKNMRTFGTGENGIDIDVKYDELSDRYPELFPSDIYSRGEQLEKIAEVAHGIKISEENMSDFADTQYGNQYKEYMRDEFAKHFSVLEKEFKTAYRFVEENAHMTKETGESRAATVNEVKELYNLRKQARRNESKAKSRELLSDNDREVIKLLLNNDVDINSLKTDNVNIAGIKNVIEYIKTTRDIDAEISEHKRRVAEERNSAAKKAIEGSDNWRDSKGNFFMSLNTMERNIKNIIPDSESANEVIENYIRPVSKSAADRVRYMDKMREKISNLKLTKDESYAVQFLGERRSELEALQNKKRLSERDKKRIELLTEELIDFKVKYGEYDNEKVNGAIKVFRETYNQIFEDMNNALIENGYDPVEYRRFYFPHFTDEGDSVLNKIARLAGLRSTIAEIPGDLTGRTQNFKPGKTFFTNALKRDGDTTSYDALTGFDKYIEGATDVIFQTKNIRNLRALTEALRYKYSKNGVKERINEIKNNDSLPPEEQQSLIDALYSDKNGLSKHNSLINELTEYTNLVANKRSSYDRKWEENWGRTTIYKLMGWAQKNISGNMIQYNLSSAASNTVALQQASAEINAIDFIHGFFDTVKALAKDDGFNNKSDFLTNRQGSDPVSRSGYEKFTAATDAMKFSDMLVSGIIVRARYYENMRKHGMSETEALSEADSYANTVIAGRAKGEMPTRFAAKNPLTKSYTMFQLEVSNQLHNIFKDAPERILSRDGAWGLAKYITKYLFGAYLYNEIYEKIFGRRMALDPLGMIEEAYENFTGYRLPKTIGELNGEKESLYVGKGTTYSALLATSDNLLEQLPFFGSMLGGGRIPYAVAKPEIKNIYDAITGEGDGKKKAGVIISDGVLPLGYALNPFGGLNQLQKTVRGFNAVNNGVVTNTGGNVQYAVGQNPGNYVKGLLLGKSALPEARRYYSGNSKPFSDKDTEEYNERVANGESNLKVYADINERRKAKDAAKMVNPFIKNSANPSNIGIYKELGRLKQSGKNVEFEAPDTEFEVDGKTVKLDSYKYARYAREAATTAEKETANLFKSKHYAPIDDKEKVLSEVYSYAKALAKTKVSNYTLTPEHQKIKLATENGISAGEFIAIKQAMGDGPKSVNKVFDFARKNGYGEQESEKLINLMTLTTDEYKRLYQRDGFKSGYRMHLLYYRAKQNGIDAKTCFVPIAKEDFSITDKKAGIKFSTTLSDKEISELQIVYNYYYEGALKSLDKMKFNNVQELYTATQKIRNKMLKSAKRDYYYYLKRTRQGQN